MSRPPPKLLLLPMVYNLLSATRGLRQRIPEHAEACCRQEAANPASSLHDASQVWPDNQHACLRITTQPVCPHMLEHAGWPAAGPVSSCCKATSGYSSTALPLLLVLDCCALEPPRPPGSDEPDLLPWGSISTHCGGMADVLVVSTSVGVLHRIHGHTTHLQPSHGWGAKPWHAHADCADWAAAGDAVMCGVTSSPQQRQR